MECMGQEKNIAEFASEAWWKNNIWKGEDMNITMEGPGIYSSGSAEKQMLSCCSNVIRRRVP